MSYWVYILKSDKDGGFYTGITNDIERRLREHHSGHEKSTKSRAPFQLVFHKECEDRATARKWEKHFKSGIGRDWVYKHL